MGKSRSQLPPRGLNAKDKANVKLILINFFFLNHSLQEEIEITNSPITSTEIEAVVKISPSPPKKVQDIE